MKYQSTRLPNDLDGNGWYETAEFIHSRQYPKTIPKHFNWVIIGAGFAGLTAAHRLAQLRPDDSIALLDAQKIGESACGRNSGFMIDVPHHLNSDNYIGAAQKDKLEIIFNRYGIDYALSLAKQFQLDQKIIAQCGKYHGATNDKAAQGLLQFAQALKKYDEPYVLLNQQELHNITGSDYYLAGLKTPKTTMIQPASYVNALAHHLPENVVLLENTPVQEINSGPKASVTTATDTYKTDNILLTNNGHLASFGFYNKRLMHVFLTASMTHELNDDQCRLLNADHYYDNDDEVYWGLVPADPMGSTVRRFGRRIVVRNQVRYSPHLRQAASAIAKHRVMHMQSFQKRFSQLSDVSMQYTWGGHLCLSLNEVHVFGKLDEGVYAATCQNGLGAAKGTANGRLLAEYVTGHHVELHDYLLSMKKPKRLWPEPFMSVGTKAVLWVKQAMAGSDL